MFGILKKLYKKLLLFEGNPVCKVENQDIYLRDIVAICCLLKENELRMQKRLYLNNIEEFQQYFDEEIVVKVQEILAELHKNKRVEIE